MPTVVSVQFNLAAALQQMGLELTRRVAIGTAMALNRTATSERAVLASEIAKDMGIRVGTVRDAMSIDKATASDLSVRVIAKGKRIPRIEFDARGPEPSRGRGSGVSYRGEAGSRIRVSNAFIATVGTGRHRGVFVRAGRSRSRKGLPSGSPGLPIRELFGPSVVHVFQKLVPSGEQRRTQTLMKNLTHEIGFALQQGA